LIVLLASIVKLDLNLSLVTVPLGTSALEVKLSITPQELSTPLTTPMLSLDLAPLVTDVDVDQVSLRSALLVPTKTLLDRAAAKTAPPALTVVSLE
jgi:hypothetical protein